MFEEYPKIGQFNDAIGEMKRNSVDSLDFTGTLKLHGTNAAITLDNSGTVRYQSRNRILNLPASDNAGFRAWAFQYEKLWKELFNKLTHVEEDDSYEIVGIYGEWCGKGIQTGVAISELPPRFVVFDTMVKLKDGPRLFYSPEHLQEVLESYIQEHNLSLDFITKYPTYKITVDINNKANINNELFKLVEEVENECPYAKVFGVSGVGEGIVWKPDTKKSSRYWFKTKGQKHSISKVKIVREVDDSLLQDHREFGEIVLTEERLEQAWSYLKEMNLELSKKSTSDFIKWLIKDVQDEHVDLMAEKRVETKDFSKIFVNDARRWFFDKLDLETSI